MKNRARNKVKIVRAEAAHAPRLSAIARAAKSFWNYPAEWLEAWRDALTISADFVRQNETYEAVCAKKLVGFSALVVREEKISLEHLWVLPPMMARGIGRQLFSHALQRAAALGFAEIEIEADPNAENFYQRMGAVRKSVIVRQVQGHRRELPILICATNRGRVTTRAGRADGPKR